MWICSVCMRLWKLVDSSTPKQFCIVNTTQYFNILFLRWVTMQAICLQYPDKQRNLYVIYEIVQSKCNISLVSRPFGQNRCPVPLACRRRRLNWGGSPDWTTKNEDLFHRRWGTIKNPPCANANSAYMIYKFVARLRLMDLLFLFCSQKQSCDIKHTSPCRCPPNVGGERCKYKYGKYLQLIAKGKKNIQSAYLFYKFYKRLITF